MGHTDNRECTGDSARSPRRDDTIPVEIRHFHLFAGLGGGARGFNLGHARVGRLQARFRCIGGVDVDPLAMKDFERLAGVKGTVLDLFDREQYRAFHGEDPPRGWREATADDIRKAAGGQRPAVTFISAPCKGFSGLLSETKSKTARYQALNRLTLRGVFLMLEAWSDDPPELVLFENVPRAQVRGRPLLDQITALLRSYGYATAETTHDCGELGGLAQSRKRFLLVARHTQKVPPLLYEPQRKPLRAVGDVLGRMPMPGELRAGPMHRMPSLAWKTWVRLALVEAGSDWRSLNRLAVEDGHLRDFVIVPGDSGGSGDSEGARFAGGERPAIDDQAPGQQGCAGSIADPRFTQSQAWNDGQAYGVRRWDQPSSTVTSKLAPGSGYGSVADPRHIGPPKHSNEFRVVRWDRSSCAVTGAHGTGQCVADPRPSWDRHGNNLVVQRWEEPSRTVIAGGKGVQGGWLSVADPRSGMAGDREAYLTGGHYGVVPWDGTAGAVSAAACHDNGRWSVADPRPMPQQDAKLVTRILSLDNTWHRPFTTLELAALQSLFDPEEHWSSDPVTQREIDERRARCGGFRLEGESDSAWRERIGNAVPSDSAQAIASEMGRTLLLAWSGETFSLSSAPVWVQPLAMAISVSGLGGAAAA
ncbi:DNA cytosine methyltransferase [Ideonella sp. DXS29W]|uniref:DNA cytosine methyltransferase n=1 Tax=Ideonella lacteola TaxID=2984193 RepID=A0ABU9C0J5_9BURK